MRNCGLCWNQALDTSWLLKACTQPRILEFEWPGCTRTPRRSWGSDHVGERHGYAYLHQGHCRTVITIMLDASSFPGEPKSEAVGVMTSRLCWNRPTSSLPTCGSS
jgi:hypothetical protein